MRWLRFGIALLRARFRRKLTISEDSVVDFRVWFTDVDASIMNHAALMTVMETGRIDLMVRSGFLALALERRWYFATRGISVQFLRPLKVFQRARLITRVSHVDEQWIHVEHQVVRRDKVVAIATVQSAVKHGRERVSYDEIAAVLDIGSLPRQRTELITLFEQEQAAMNARLGEVRER
ncbi:MAG: acyl-CoA thioesterase [Acidobacteria bacterium]|nr:acyl-CoA thioesterase [Acidobacteriota bacterium]